MWLLAHVDYGSAVLQHCPAVDNAPIGLVCSKETCEALARDILHATGLSAPIDAFYLAELLAHDVMLSDAPARTSWGRAIFVSRRAPPREQHAMVAAELACIIMRHARRFAAPEGVALIARALLLPLERFAADVAKESSPRVLAMRHETAPVWMIERRIVDVESMELRPGGATAAR